MRGRQCNWILAAFISVFMLMGLLPATVSAAPDDSWTDYVEDSFEGGTGTKEDPYLIATEGQLAKLSKDVAEDEDGLSYEGVYFRLENDMDLSAYVWTPIGTHTWWEEGTESSMRSFCGFFDGNGKTISGLYVDEKANQRGSAGLFGRIVKTNANTEVGVQNLTIDQADIYVGEEGFMEVTAGILAGSVISNPGMEIEISNVTVSGSVTVEATDGNNKAGGMVGDAARVNFTDCHAENITVSYGGTAGGFVGLTTGDSYTNCTASGTVEGLWNQGGFAGHAGDLSGNGNLSSWEDVSSFTGCLADVDVTGDDWRIGGFVGFLEGGNIIGCVAEGDVTSYVKNFQPKAGGFVGEMSNADFPVYDSFTSIQKSHAAGVTVGNHPSSAAGGFVGAYSGGTVDSCSYDIEKNPTLKGAGEEPADISGIAGVSTAKVHANICRDYYGGHQMTKTEAKEPTYTEEGNIAYWHCGKCGEYFSDEAGENNISYEDTIIPKLQGSSTIYYALHFATNGGENMNSVVKESGTVMDLSEYVPVREGYTFTGWYADEELTQPVTEVTLDNTKTIYAGWEEIVTDTRLDQEISMTNPYQERDLANGSRNTMSKVCTLKLGFAVDDPDLSISYETSDPEVATVEDGKITYQGVGTCMITVTAAETDLCKAASLEIPVTVGSLGTPTFTPTVTVRTAQKAFVVTSSTVRGVDGYEVQYSIRDDFWRATTKDFPDTGAKLYRETCTTVHSNMTYYIHVRGYQVINGEKVYSEWSPVKTVKTK